MKKFMILFTVFAMFFLVSCGGSSNNDSGDTDTGDTVPDTGDTAGDTGDTEADTGDTQSDTGDTAGDTDADTGDSEAGDADWEAKYKKADESAAKVSEDVVNADNRLGMEIFSRLAKEEGAKNIMISPLSISIAMAMTANGAVDDTLAEMKDVLGFGEMEMPDVNEQFAQLIASLAYADKDMVLEIADSVWMSNEFAPDVKADFISVLEDFYAAAFYTEDFSDDATADKINAWVSEKTHEKIDKIVDEISPNTVMYLINAVYFKAAWTTSFDKDSTYKSSFFLTDGSQKEVEYMAFAYDQEEPEFYSFSSEYGDKEGYSVVRLPYGRGKFAFYGIVPNDSEYNIDDLIAKAAEDGTDFFGSLEERKFPVMLPKFKFAYEKSLVDTFKALGMEKAFVGGLQNIAGAPHNPFISDIYHKTFIEVNEEGTEAAAVTSVEVGENAIPTGFFATRPFAFVIRDDRTGSILFMGKVEDPTAEK